MVVRDQRATEAMPEFGLVIELRGRRRLCLPGSTPAVRVAELIWALEAPEAMA